MDKSIIEKIAHWSIVAGVPVKSEFELPAIERLSISGKIIAEEALEALIEINKKTEINYPISGDLHPINVNFEKFIDGLGDLLWVTIRAMMEIGIDPNEVIDRIYHANMSKFDNTIEEAEQTYLQYANKNILSYCKQVGEKYVTYRVGDNKVLKSHKFTPPNFEDLWKQRQKQ